MKMFIVGFIVSFIVSSFGMDIDRTYEHMVKDFWQEFLGKELEEDWRNKKDIKCSKETENYFIVYKTWPITSNIVYLLKKGDKKIYQQIFELCDKKNYSLFLDTLDLDSSKYFRTFLEVNYLSYYDQQCIMEGSLEEIQKNLKEQIKGLSHFFVRQVKSQSFKDLKINLGDKDDLIDVLFHDKMLEKNKTKLLYLLRCANVKVFMGLYNVEQFNKKIPVAANVMYSNKDSVMLISLFEKIKPNISVVSETFNNKKTTISIDSTYRKRMFYKALKNAHKDVKKVLIASSQGDKKFFEEIGMKNTRTINQYNL